MWCGGKGMGWDGLGWDGMGLGMECGGSAMHVIGAWMNEWMDGWMDRKLHDRNKQDPQITCPFFDAEWKAQTGFRLW